MYGHDPQRSNWAPEETTLTTANVAGLSLQWKAALQNPSYSLSALTSPVVAAGISTARGIRNVVLVAGVTGTVFALDASDGAQLWAHTFKPAVLPGKGKYQGTFLCPNGITATPVIDKAANILYVLAPDGALFGFDPGSGLIRYGPVQFVAPFAKSLSLNLKDGQLYTSLAQGCGNALSGFYSVDVRDRHHPVIHQGLLSNTDTAGIWGRGGPVIGANGRVYGGTGDGHFDTAEGDYSNAVVAASASGLDVADYFLPPNWAYLKKKDFDMGSSSPVYFGWRNRDLLAHAAKEGVIYLLDADSLGGKDHQTALYTSPRWGNDRAFCCDGFGFWGAMAAARDVQGQAWLYAPLGGPLSTSAPAFPVSHGDAPHGSILAFKVSASPTHDPVLEPAWISADFDIPDAVVVANGIVFALSTGENANQRGGEKKRLLNTHPAVLRALDAATGAELYNSANTMTSWTHFTGLAIANGKVFAVDHDSNVYCFGLNETKPGRN